MKFYKAFNKETSILCLDFSSNRISIRIMHPTELSVSPNYFWRGILKFQFLSINTNETTKKFLIFSKRLSKRLPKDIQKISKRQSKRHQKYFEPIGELKRDQDWSTFTAERQRSKKGAKLYGTMCWKREKKNPPLTENKANSSLCCVAYSNSTR